MHMFILVLLYVTARQLTEVNTNLEFKEMTCKLTKLTLAILNSLLGKQKGGYTILGYTKQGFLHCHVNSNSYSIAF